MCEPTTIMMGVSLAMTALGTMQQMSAARAEGKAAQQAADYRAAVDRNNSIIAERQAADARERGAIAERAQRQKTRQLIGRQRAALAGSGQVVDVGSALDITVDTAGIGEVDALTVRANAEREAMGYEVNAMNFNASADLNTMAGQSAVAAASNRSTAALINGIGTISSQWYGQKKVGAWG